MDISSYDHFFMELEKKLKSAPENRTKIIRKSVRDSQCPYLKNKLQSLYHVFKVFFLVAIAGVFTAATAQMKVQVVDNQTSQPLVGATVAFQGINTGESVMEIADASGSVTSTISLPVLVIIRHLGYEAFTDTLDVQSDSFIASLSPSASQLDEVVVTGQFEPESARNSVYKVRTLGAQRIAAQGATSLQDVLSNELNIHFSRDNATGSSGLSLQGLSGQHVKVLVDGVSMVGRSGTANEIDLGQINVQSIDRVEIVEGPLAVNYGADALAGVINIITKKAENTQSLNVLLQEESVGNEYSLFEEGIHNASIRYGSAIGSKWYVQGETRINQFGGWTGTGEGRDKSWYPKTQLFGGGLIRFKHENFDVFYRFDYLDETLENKGQPNDNNPLRDPYAIDEEYLSKRWMHQLQGNVKFGKASLNSVFSFTDYARRTHQFNKNLVTEDETTTIESEQDTIFYQTVFTRQTVNNLLHWTSGSVVLKAQLGVDGELERAGGSTLSDGDKQIFNAGAFTSIELALGPLKIRPGVRLTYNSVFSTTPTPSVNFKYQLTENTNLRLGYGRGFRAPSTRELYHEFIDANHNILGNDELKPEYSHSFNADVTHDLKKLPVTFSVNGFYNHIDDQITYFTPADPNQPTSYTNLLVYKTTGGTVSGSFERPGLNIQLGSSYIGTYQRLNETNSEEVPEFVFSPSVNANLQYLIPNIKIQLAAFYKYTGPTKRYLLDESDEPGLRRQEDFHFLDLTVSRKFEVGLSAAIGVRNAMDVTSVNNSIAGGAHNSNSGQTPIAYGRSYFLRLSYQFLKH